MTRNLLIDCMAFLKEAGWLSVVVVVCVTVVVATQMIRTSQWLRSE